MSVLLVSTKVLDTDRVTRYENGSMSDLQLNRPIIDDQAQRLYGFKGPLKCILPNWEFSIKITYFMIENCINTFINEFFVPENGAV